MRIIQRTSFGAVSYGAGSLLLGVLFLVFVPILLLATVAYAVGGGIAVGIALPVTFYLFFSLRAHNVEGETGCLWCKLDERRATSGARRR